MTGGAGFTLTGTFAGFLPGSTDPVFTHDVSGTGAMTVSASSVLYQFDAPGAPVPEPAAFLLVAGGLAAAVRMRRPRRAGASSPGSMPA
jgi:hypothetical protein